MGLRNRRRQDHRLAGLTRTLRAAGRQLRTFGCYPGQEVVSRVQHIGETSRRAAFGLVAGTEAPLPGAPVYCDGAEAGFVTQAVAGEISTLVAFSSLRSALTGRLTLTPEGAPISILPLPYKIPSAA